MPIRYAGDAYNLAAGTRGAFAGLSADLEREGLPAMLVNDGDRELQDEIDVFLARFRPQKGGAGPYNDVRHWQGVRYVRFSPLGTVAPPGSGNHGKRRANDLGYPYNSDTPAHRRAQVLAKRHNITCEGMGFREWWHWTFWGPLGVIGSPASSGKTNTRPTLTPEVRMDHVKITDGGGFRHAITNGYEFQQGELNDAGGLGALWTELYGPPRPVSGAAWKEALRVAALFSSVRAKSLKAHG